MGYYVANKQYELANLPKTFGMGNVLAVVTDRKLPQSTTYYTADVISYSDYYPFGMQMPDRNGDENIDDYRYGFNGMEKDDEVKGNGNSYDFGARMYDSRLGRFLSLDNYFKKYPSQSAYVFASNLPLSAVDINGDSTYLVIYGAGYTNYKKKGLDGDQGNLFQLHAEALKEKIEASAGFDPNEDEVIIVYAPSSEQFFDAVNKQYQSGAIKQLDVFSHGYGGGISLGGRMPNDPGSSPEIAEQDFKVYENREINIYNMNNINPSSIGPGATCTFWGCNMGFYIPPDKNDQFAFEVQPVAQEFANYTGSTVHAFNGSSETDEIDGKKQYGYMIRTKERGDGKGKIKMMEFKANAKPKEIIK